MNVMGGQLANDLTPKQEAFAIAFVETSNATAAYRSAYSTSKMSPGAIFVEASRLAANPKVALKIAELRQQAVIRHQITVDQLIGELDEARDMALSAEVPQTSAAIAATLGKAKLLGLLVDKVDARVLTASLPVKVDDLI